MIDEMKYLYLLTTRKAIIENGLWHQLRTDHGREFYLMVEIQNYLRSIRGPSNILPHVQSPSTEVSLKHVCDYETT